MLSAASLGADLWKTEGGQAHQAMGGINRRPLPQAAVRCPRSTGAGDVLASRKGGTGTEVNRPGR